MKASFFNESISLKLFEMKLSFVNLQITDTFVRIKNIIYYLINTLIAIQR